MAEQIVLIRSVILVELILVCLSESKPSATKSNSLNQVDQIAQEQRLALHIITSTPETSSSRRLNAEEFRQPAVSYDLMESQPSPGLGWLSNQHHSPRVTSSRLSSAPKRIVINLNHGNETSKISPAANNQSTVAHSQSRQNNSSRAARRRDEVAASAEDSFASQRRQQQDPSTRRSSMREVLMDSVLRQGGIPAIVVDRDGNQMMHKGRKLMLGAEMLDRMTTRPMAGQTKQQQQPTDEDDSESNRNHFIGIETHSSGSATSEDDNQSKMVAGGNKREEYDGRPDYQQENGTFSNQMEPIESNNETPNSNNNGRQQVQSRAPAAKSSALKSAANQQRKTPSRGSLALANQRQVSWNKNNANFLLDRQSNGRQFVYSLQSTSPADQVDSDSVDVMKQRNEVQDLTADDSPKSLQDSIQENFDSANNIQSDDRAKYDRLEPKRQAYRRLSENVRLSPQKNVVSNPLMARNEQHGNLASANGVRIVVAVDETEPNSFVTKSHEVKATTNQREQIQKSATQKTPNTTRGRRNPLTMSSSDRIADFLEQLKLYTTRDQLMKVANEMQQYPDQKEAEKMAQDQEQEQQQISQTNPEAQKTLGTSNRARHATRTVMLPASNQLRTVSHSVRNNVPAPIVEEDFADSLVTSASYQRNSPKPEPQEKGKYLSREAQLRTKMNRQPSEEEENDEPTTTDSFGQLVMANVMQNSASQEPHQPQAFSREDPRDDDDDDDEYTNNKDLLNTMEASATSYNSQDDGAENDERAAADSTTATPMNQEDNRESTGNEREDEEIKILEQVIDELVAAERERKQQDQNGN